VPSNSTEEMTIVWKEMIPDVPVNNPHGDYPQDAEIPPPPPELEESSRDEAAPKP
jgi:hypothetical protein